MEASYWQMRKRAYAGRPGKTQPLATSHATRPQPAKRVKPACERH